MTRLFVYGSRHLGDYPALLICAGAARVRGEVYRIDRGRLSALDRYEGHPWQYRRTRIALADGSEALTYLYAGRHAGRAPRIASGSWREKPD